MKTTYIITGNNYACAAMDFQTLIERVSARFSHLDNLNEVVGAIIRWAKDEAAGYQLDIAGFTVISKERN